MLKKRIVPRTGLLLLVFMVLIISLLISSYKFNKVNIDTVDAATEEWTYLNDLAGVYKIRTKNPTYGEWRGFDIQYGQYSNNSDAPRLMLWFVDDTSPNRLFQFVPIEMINGKMVYYITSPFDNDGRIDVKDGYFSENQPIWFWKVEGSSRYNNAQRWCVKTNDGGTTVQIELACDSRFVLSSKASNDLVTLSENKDSSVSLWRLENIAGDYGINTHTYLMNDNIGYSNFNNEKSRFLEPLKSGNSYVSDIISVGVRGDNIKKTTYNGVQAFSIRYDSNFYIYTSFVYSGLKWENYMPLGPAPNSKGKMQDWKLSNDTYSFKDVNGNENQVQQGLLSIEISKDNYNWQKYRMINFTSSLSKDELLLRLDTLKINKD